jgi:hypothetical protein
LNAPATAIAIEDLEEAPDSDREGAVSGVLRRATPQIPDYEGAGISDRTMAELLCMAARAERWDAVAIVARFKR